MEVQNQVGRSLRANLARLCDVLDNVRIPEHSDHRFRLIPITDSDGFRSLIPTEFDQ